MKLVTLIVLLFLCSCELDGPSSAVLETTVYVDLVDTNGYSLLQKDIRKWKVDIYNQIGDQWERVDYGSRLAYPEDFDFIGYPPDDTLMMLFLNYHENPSLTVIDWGDGLFDTIQADYRMGSNYTILERAFHKGEQLPYDTARQITLLTLVRQ